MQANPVAVRIRNPCHPAYARFDRFDENLDAAPATNFDRCANVVDRQRHTCRTTPVPFRTASMSGAIETKGQRFRGELAPEIVPLVPPLEAKKLPIERTGAPDVLRAIHYEIKRPNRN